MTVPRDLTSLFGDCFNQLHRTKNAGFAMTVPRDLTSLMEIASTWFVE
jgi:hypothetical protein